ncbi:MAG: family 1 glycosylhydrolase [Oscillospiraceae bacterium]|nr:family 1 glycosylhydrolase [Oscillospiraceae bacterium]
MYDVFSLKAFEMPEGFLWGSGYAGHQVEGNNINSDHYFLEQKYFEEKSGLACNSYEMYKTDIDLAETLGHQAFRTSVEWSRIEPEEGVFCEEAIAHYVALFSQLKEKGLQTFATLVHFSVPQWFKQKGGFSVEENLKYFKRYVEYIVPKIAPFVDFYNVINEFNLVKEVDFKVNSVKAHAAGYHIIKKYSSAPVSSAHALVQYMPYRPHDRADRIMTDYCDFMDHEFFFHAMRTGELIVPGRDAEYLPDIKDTVDFWSVNSYTRSMIDARNSGCGGERYAHKVLKLTDMDFYLEEFYPECLIANLTRLTDKPIYITENGCSCTDDRFRIVYLALHLSAIREAIKMGAQVKGYLHWSLLDNYEWMSYKPHFGLCEVNRETFERTPKPSAWFYKELIENNGYNTEILRRYLHELPSIGLTAGTP